MLIIIAPMNTHLYSVNANGASPHREPSVSVFAKDKERERDGQGTENSKEKERILATTTLKVRRSKEMRKDKHNR